MNERLLLRDFSLVFVLLGCLLFFGLVAPQYLSPRNLSMLSIEFAITSVLSLGMLLVILPGHIDLSAGSGVGLVGGIAAVLIMRCRLPAEAAMVVAMVVGLLVWRLQGRFIHHQRIPAFIITLGGLLVCKGLFWLCIRNQTVPVSPGGQSNLLSVLTTTYVPPAMSYGVWVVVVAVLGLRARHSHMQARKDALSMGEKPPDGERPFLRFFVTAQALLLLVIVTGQFRGLPLPLLILAGVAVCVQVLLQHTRFGRALYAVGGNEEAAALSGIEVGKVVIAAYTLLGGLVALTGLLQTAYAGASTTTVGELMELDAVAACVIGGCSLRGGRGTVGGVLLGSLLLACLLSGMSLLAVPPEARLIARGLTLGLAAWLDVRLSRSIG